MFRDCVILMSRMICVQLIASVLVTLRICLSWFVSVPGVDVFFFFSSRRRHTRYWRDWSSDVCSSDLLFTLHHPDVLPDDDRDGQDAARGLREVHPDGEA